MLNQVAQLEYNPCKNSMVMLKASRYSDVKQLVFNKDIKAAA